LRHLSEAEDWVDEILELVHMENRSDSYISSLSKGMRQRVGLAQALLHKPDVLILDEPTIGLDPAHIIDVRKIIQNMGKDRTVLLSTHILSEAQQVCDRVLIINKGKIVAEDSPKNLQSRVADAQQIYLQIGGNLDNLEEIVTNVEGVTAISGGFEGKFEIQTSSEIDARPEIARAVIKAGYDLLELKPLGMDLEEIFLELTQDDQKLKGKISEEGKSNA
jgi:ABC-2 type transport system ATP-binding protein